MLLDVWKGSTYLELVYWVQMPPTPWASSHGYQSVVSYCPEDWIYNRYWRGATSQFPGVVITRKELWHKVLTATSGRGREAATPADRVLQLQRASLGRTTCSHQQTWLWGNWGNGKENGTDGCVLRKRLQREGKDTRSGTVTRHHPQFQIQQLSDGQTYDLSLVLFTYTFLVKQLHFWMECVRTGMVEMLYNTCRN